LKLSDKSAPPSSNAESLEAPGKPTILFYGHYDVQPAEPFRSLDHSCLRTHRAATGNSFGRGTGRRTKARFYPPESPRVAPESERQTPINVKVLIEGEEEVGSVSLWDYVQKK